LARSWNATRPTPGVANLFTRQAGDTNEDGQFDQFDLILTLQGGEYLSGQPASWRDGDWNGDGRFDQLDVISALRTGNYLQGPYASWTAAGAEDLDRNTVSGQRELPADSSGPVTGVVDLAYMAAVDLLMEEDDRD